MTDPNRPEASKPRNMVLRLLGPGLVTGAADDDPSGIAIYSQAGAQFGCGLLWTVFLTTPFMIAIQLVSARIGRVTGKGLAANVMELAPRWLVLALVFLLVAANTFNIAADIAAMGESLSLVIGGLDHEHALIFASASTLLLVFVPYRRYAPVRKFMTLTLFAYVATALTVKIPWSTGLGFTGIAAIHMLVWSAVLNGIVAVPIMAMMMAIVANSRLMGRFTAPPPLIALGWIGTGLMALAVAALTWSFFAG